MDGAESSSESEMEVDDQSEEETNTKVHLFSKYMLVGVRKHNIQR